MQVLFYFYVCYLTLSHYPMQTVLNCCLCFLQRKLSLRNVRLAQAYLARVQQRQLDFRTQALNKGLPASFQQIAELRLGSLRNERFVGKQKGEEQTLSYSDFLATSLAIKFISCLQGEQTGSELYTYFLLPLQLCLPLCVTGNFHRHILATSLAVILVFINITFQRGSWCSV